jgi:hypothetical protein
MEFRQLPLLSFVMKGKTAFHPRTQSRTKCCIEQRLKSFNLKQFLSLSLFHDIDIFGVQKADCLLLNLRFLDFFPLMVNSGYVFFGSPTEGMHLEANLVALFTSVTECGY